MYLIIILLILALLCWYKPMIEGFDYYFYPPVRCIDNAFGQLRCFDNIGYPDYPWNAPYWSGYKSNDFNVNENRISGQIDKIV